MHRNTNYHSLSVPNTEDSGAGIESTTDTRDLRIHSEKYLKLFATQMAPIVGATIKALQSPATREAFVNFQKITESIQVAIKVHAQQFNAMLQTLGPITEIDWGDIYRQHAESLCFAAEHDWFVHGDMGLSEIIRIREFQSRKDIKGLDDYFSQCIARDKDNILNKLLERYPERSEIMNEAFKLHDEGRYLAAIPLMITMAEGIGLERTNKSAFNLNRNAPVIAQYFERSKEEVYSIFTKPMKIKHPLSTKRKGRLNRHSVLHGLDINYGTQLNSLQAMSFLSCLGWLLQLDEVELIKDVT